MAIQEAGKKRPYHIMLDFETMGVRPNAAIVSIGAVMFEPTEAPNLTASSKLIDYTCARPTPIESPYFYRTVDLQSCIDRGFRVDGDTIKWWMRQPEEARSEIFRNTVTLDRAIKDFLQWWAENAPDNDTRLWSNGAGFDAVILDSICKVLMLVPRHHYANVRDTRTLWDLYADDVKRWKDANPNPRPHHALYDAWYQSLIVQLCWVQSQYYRENSRKYTELRGAS